MKSQAHWIANKHIHKPVNVLEKHVKQAQHKPHIAGTLNSY